MTSRTAITAFFRCFLAGLAVETGVKLDVVAEK